MKLEKIHTIILFRTTTSSFCIFLHTFIFSRLPLSPSSPPCSAPHSFKKFPTSLLNTNPLYSKIIKNPDDNLPSLENVLNLPSAKLLKYMYHSSFPSPTSVQRPYMENLQQLKESIQISPVLYLAYKILKVNLTTPSKLQTGI